MVEQRDTSGVVERHLLGKLEEVKLQPECGHRHVKRMPENTLELCVQRLFTACPGAQQDRLLTRHRRAESCIIQVPLVPLNVAAATHNRSLDLPFWECLFFISSGFRVATAARARIHSASPDQTSALFMQVTAASVCSRAVTRHSWSLKNTSSSLNCRFRSPRKGSSASTSGQTSEGKEGHVELADKPTEPPGAR